MSIKKKSFSGTEIFVLIVSFFSILPFLILSFYNNPSADDFIYSNSFINDGFLQAQYNYYIGWSGRYTATAVLSLNPVSFHNFTAYKLESFFLLLLMGTAFYYLIKQVFYKENLLTHLSISLFLFTLFLFQMPKVASGFFWGAGAETYQLGNVFFLFMLMNLHKYFEQRSKQAKILTVLFLFLLIGSNETLMLLTNIILFLIVIFYYGKQQRFHLNYIKKHPFIAFLLFLSILFSLIVILAPGNDVRLGFLPNKHKKIAFYNSYLSAKKYSIEWLPMVSLMSLLIISLVKNTSIYKSSRLFIHPIFAFLLLLILIYAGFFPAHWSMGVPPPKRTINTIYFFFILSWIYFVFSLFHYFKNNEFPKAVTYVLMLTIVIFMLKPNNVQTAYQDWLSGDAKKYNQQLTNRNIFLNNAKKIVKENDTIRVSSLVKIPKTLFFSDLGSKASDWRNKTYSSYYKVPYIVLKKKKK